MAVTPFNSIEELCSFCSFRQGAGGANDFGDALKQSVIDGTFAPSQLELALTQAREEIYSRAGQKENDEYETERYYQLRQCELWLATSSLCLWYGKKTALKFPESNLAGVGSITVGSDTPPPTEKMEVWTRAAREYRAIGERLLTGMGQAWDMKVGTLRRSHSHHPCLSTGCCSHCEEHYL